MDVAMAKLTKKQLSEYREVFNLYDRERKGCIEASKLGTVLRSLGQTPTEATLSQITNEYNRRMNGRVTFDEFIKVLNSVSAEKLSVEDLQEAFRVFDKTGNGMVSADDLRHYLTTLGEKLSEEEVEELLAIADIDKDGNIDYSSFSHKLLS